MTWGINDDFVLEQIIESNNFELHHSIVPFMSYALGLLLAVFYKLFGDLNWYGIFISSVNLISILTYLKVIKSYMFSVTKKLSYVILIILGQYLILSPTYTVTSIVTSFAGLFYLIFLLKTQEKSMKQYFCAGSILALGVSLRVDSLKGLFAFFGLYVVFFGLTVLRKSEFKNQSIKITWFALPVVVVLLSQFFINILLVSSSPTTANYLKWQEIRHELFYTPAILKLHQSVAAGEVLQDTWGDVEFTLLRNWVYGDTNVYSAQNLEIGKEYVEKYIGIKGLFSADPIIVFENLYDYLIKIKLILFFVFVLSVLSLFVTKNLRLLITLNLALFIGYFSSFYYAAAVLRLPIRVTLPYSILLLLLLLFNLNLTSVRDFAQGKRFLILYQLSLICFLIWFISFKSFGSVPIIKSNNVNIEWAKTRNDELSLVDNKSIFIGPLVHLPVAYSGPYLTDDLFTTTDKTLVLSWSNFSPKWKDQASYLGINPNNIFESLAKNKDVYLVSEPGLASVIEMYMNDHNIIRGKLCSVLNLSGYDNAKVYTFQAKEDDC